MQRAQNPLEERDNAIRALQYILLNIEAQTPTSRALIRCFLMQFMVMLEAEDIAGATDAAAIQAGWDLVYRMLHRVRMAETRHTASSGI